MQDMAGGDRHGLVEGKIVVVVRGILPPDRVAEIDRLSGNLAESAFKDEVAFGILGQDVVRDVGIRRSDDRLMPVLVEGPVGNRKIDA